MTKGPGISIGAASRATGVSARMIRHYETIGLLEAAPRTEGNYRLYRDRDVQALRFIARARRMGFGLDDIRGLLTLWRDRERPSIEVRRLAQRHVDDLRARIAEMESMVSTLGRLVDACHGDDRPDCPILEDLESGPSACGGTDRGDAAGRAPHRAAARRPAPSSASS